MTKTLTPEGAVKQAMLGWDGSAWRKLPMVWGYSALYRQRVLDTDTAAGTIYLSGSAVPAGEIWVVNSICIFNTVSAIPRVAVYITGGATSMYLGGLLLLAQYQIVAIHGAFVMEEDEKIQAAFTDCILHDSITLDIGGYKMKITE